MSNRHTERAARVQECEQQAQAMMDAAANAKNEEAKFDYLRLATEWLKLAGEISKRRQ